MALLSDDDAKWWSAGKAFLGQVVADAFVDRVAGGGEGGDVRHLAARHERERRCSGQPEQLEHPAPGHGLESGDGRGRPGEACVLIPRGDEPVRCERGRECAADDEAEVAARAHRSQARFRGRRQFGDDGSGLRAVLRDGAVGRPQHRRVVDVGSDRSGVERLEVPSGDAPPFVRGARARRSRQTGLR